MMPNLKHSGFKTPLVLLLSIMLILVTPVNAFATEGSLGGADGVAGSSMVNQSGDNNPDNPGSDNDPDNPGSGGGDNPGGDNDPDNPGSGDGDNPGGDNDPDNPGSGGGDNSGSDNDPDNLGAGDGDNPMLMLAPPRIVEDVDPVISHSRTTITQQEYNKLSDKLSSAQSSWVLAKGVTLFSGKGSTGWTIVIDADADCGTFYFASHESKNGCFTYEINIVKQGVGRGSTDFVFGGKSPAGVNHIKFLGKDTPPEPDPTGSLMIVKNVSGLETMRDFTFEVENSKGEIESYTIKAESFDTDGRGSIKAEDLALGDYNVTELDPEVTGYNRIDTSSETEQDAKIIRDKTTTVTFNNNYEQITEPGPVPFVYLSVEKKVKDINNYWADSASYTANSINAEFLITVSLDVSEYLEYMEEIGEEEFVWISGELRDVLDGVDLDLGENSSFELYYRNADDQRLTQSLTIQVPLAGLGMHTNVVTIDTAVSEISGGDSMIVQGEDDADVTLTASGSRTITPSRSSGGSPPVARVTPVTILDEEVPLTDIPDEPVPLALPHEEEEIIIVDEEIPLGDLPKMGVPAASLALGMGGLAAMLGGLLTRKGRKLKK